jgi:sugar phosphate isomerase/epimerase
VNRREFNRLVGLSSLGLAAGNVFGAEFDYPWKLGVITDEADPDLAHVLKDFYPKYKLNWAEIRNVKLDGKSTYVYNKATPAQLKEIRKQLDDANVKLSLLDTAIYKIPFPGTKPLGIDAADLHPARGKMSEQMEDLKRAAAAAHALGTDRLRIFAFQRVADPSAIFNQVVESLNKALVAAKQEGVNLLLENEFSCNVATGAESAQLFKAISDKRLQHNWDPGNCVEAGENPFPTGWDLLDHSRITHIHLKDAAKKPSGQGYVWKPIGGGVIDFHGQFEALKKIQYSGTLSLETHYKNAQHDPWASTVESMDGLVKTLKAV